AGMAHQVLEQAELPHRQLDPMAGADHGALPRVDDKVAADELAGPLDDATADERANAGKQLGKRKRLGQVVVGADVESTDAVVDSIAGRQHQDWRPAADLPEPSADLDAVEVGQT